MTTFQIAVKTSSSRRLGLEVSIMTAIAVVGDIIDGDLLFGVHDCSRGCCDVKEGGKEGGWGGGEEECSTRQEGGGGRGREGCYVREAQKQQRGCDGPVLKLRQQTDGGVGALFRADPSTP